MTETAIRSKMDCIITRNKKDYAKAGIPIYDPIEFWNLLKNDDVNDEILVKWRSHAYLLFSNWLNYYVYQNTPYNLDDLLKMKTTNK